MNSAAEIESGQTPNNFSFLCETLRSLRSKVFSLALDAPRFWPFHSSPALGRTERPDIARARALASAALNVCHRFQTQNIAPIEKSVPPPAVKEWPNVAS